MRLTSSGQRRAAQLRCTGRRPRRESPEICYPAACLGAGERQAVGRPNKRVRLPVYVSMRNLTIELEREEDGRWIAEIEALPGALAYGTSREEAIARAEALAFRVLAERLENGEPVPEVGFLFAVAG